MNRPTRILGEIKAKKEAKEKAKKMKKLKVKGIVPFLKDHPVGSQLLSVYSYGSLLSIFNQHI